MRDIIVETLGCEADQVTLEASLADDLGADSLASVELVMALEEAANIKIDDADVANLKTVGDIMDYLNTHKEMSAAGGHRAPRRFLSVPAQSLRLPVKVRRRRLVASGRLRFIRRPERLFSERIYHDQPRKFLT